MPITEMTLPADVYTKVLTNVRYEGQVFEENLPERPNEYRVAFVNTGAAKPADSDPGILFNKSFSPSHEPESPATGSDYYVKPKGKVGKVIVIT